MLPLYLLTNAKGQQMRVELKNGEVIEGKLTNVDNWMNLTLSNVSEYKGSDAFASPQTEVMKSTEIYVRGTFIKYINLPDDIIDIVKQQINMNNSSNSNRKYIGSGNRYGSSGSGGRSGGYNRRDNYNNNSSGRRNYNAGNRRSYQQNQQQHQNQHQQQHQQQYHNNNNENRTNPNGMGGYVQIQQLPSNTNPQLPSQNVEF
ncbi:U6 snRNA complex subunit LSM4 NDAI_0A01520 [Naumovozyma dairenensis CBS 421]|uniref:LSM complex subunit LSM4 n=1 Tax=Naumovozyma dairenensis (strain ATCC 10597 / BCRC 20456 / CBS 421 / NBRC 0211 / NRRL Y-12639) TaxID=1071378 RepID=G0W3C2_NAUDC|nr:hypothetical protein NDAI_0A01520 [Naumovozyma dairenensis CBS 421]CCD22310.1 hypothetical protein NDAI_0A01520 [Naumovozyma dairenensis CBS 421]